MSFRAFWVMTVSHMLSALLCQINVCCGTFFAHWLPCNVPSLWNAATTHWSIWNQCPSSGLVVSLYFDNLTIQCKCYCMHGKTKQLVFHITTLCFTNPNACRNITPTRLQSLLFNIILNTTTNWKVGFHMWHLFYFHYFHFLSTSLMTSWFPTILLPKFFPLHSHIPYCVD